MSMYFILESSHLIYQRLLQRMLHSKSTGTNVPSHVYGCQSVGRHLHLRISNANHCDGIYASRGVSFSRSLYFVTNGLHDLP